MSATKIRSPTTPHLIDKQSHHVMIRQVANKISEHHFRVFEYVEHLEQENDRLKGIVSSGFPRQKKLDVIANHLQWWLNFNEDNHAKDGNSVDDNMHVIPPTWPTRKQLKLWIDALADNNEQS